MHIDLWGPSPKPSRNGHSYNIAFVDAFTEYTWLYLFKHKSNVIHAFKLYHKYVATQFNSNMEDVQSDFVHRLTCPHTIMVQFRGSIDK